MKHILISIIFLINALVLKAQGISVPEITCVSVLPNGDVSITWNVVSDPSSEFVQYELEADGSVIANIANINTNTFLHTPSGAAANSVSYVLKVKGTGGSGAFTLTSQSFSTIYLDVTNNADGYATLTWNNPNGFSTGKFYIYRSESFGVFNLDDSVAVTQTNYLDEINFICSETQLDYRISYKYSSTCESFSNTDGTIFKDLLPPAEVSILDIDVDPTTGFTTLTWQESPEVDVKEYKILKLNPASLAFQQIDVVVGKSNTTYTDFNLVLQSAAVASQSYKVIPVDDCDNNQGLNFLSTIFVNGIPENCKLSIELEWNSFINGQTGNNQIIESSIVEVATSYELWVDIGAGFNFYTSLPKGTTTYTIENVIPKTLICYQIRAILPNGEVSNSSQYCYNIPLQPVSLENYIAYASVTELEEIELKLYTESVIPNNVIEVYKSSDNGATYINLHSESVSQNVFKFIDSEVDVQSQSYQYYFVIKDVCGLRRDSSNIASSIYLETKYDDFDSIPEFYWNSYNHYYSNVDKYILSRSLNKGAFEAVDSVPNNYVYTTDHIKKVLRYSFKTLCYQLKAVEDTLNKYGFKEESFSNKVCIEDVPTVYIPSGFLVGGISGNFKPRFTYLIDKNYEFYIYNRWGQTIFQTNDPFLGWDGYYGGSPVPSGTYAYKIIYKNELNEDQLIVGSVTVIN